MSSTRQLNQRARHQPAGPAPVTRRVPKPPYTWAGHTWAGLASMIMPLCWAALAAFIAALIRYNDIPWWLVMPFSLLVILTGIGSVMGEKFSEAVRIYIVGFALLAAGWLSWLSFDAPPGTMRTFLEWGLPSFSTLGAFATWPAVRNAQIRKEARRYRLLRGGGLAITAGGQPAEDVYAGDPRGRFWEELFASLKKPGMQFVEEKALGDNVAIRMRLPRPGGAHAPIPFSTIASEQFTELIEQALEGLRPGAVRIERVNLPNGQASTREFWMHLDYADILAKIIAMPREHHPISINEAFPVGKYQDGKTLYLTLREIHAMIVAVTRMGKSNLLHVVIHQLTRCYDAAVWMIDLKGGATARPWLMAWVEGRAKRPVLDWVAIDRWEAARIILAAIDIMRDRPLRRRGSKTEPARAGMRTADGSIAKHDRPAIIVLCDEVAELLGSHSGPQMTSSAAGFTSGYLGKLVTSLVCLGAGEAVWGMFAGQGQTADMFGSPSAQKQMGLKIAIGPMGMQDAQAVFANSAYVAASMLKTLVHKGSCLVWKFGIDKILPAKIFFMGDAAELDARCDEAAIAHSEIVSTVELDPLAKPLADEWGFADRWTNRKRCGWLFLDEVSDDGGVQGWEGVPIPLTNNLQPIRLSKWRELQQARAAGATPTAPGATMTATPPTPPDPQQPRSTGFWGAGKSAQPTHLHSVPTPAPGPIDASPAAADAVVTGFEKLLAAPGAPPDDDSGPAGDDGSHLSYDKVQRTAELIDAAGPAGIGAAELAAKMVEAGLITPRGVKAYRRLVLRAMQDGGVVDPGLKVEQPGGNGTRYYTARQLRRRPAA